MAGLFTEGAQYFFNAISGDAMGADNGITIAKDSLYVGLLARSSITDDPPLSSTLATLTNECTGSGGYARKIINTTNVSITSNNMTLVTPVQWSGITISTPATHAFIATASGSSGKLIGFVRLSQARSLAPADVLTENPTITLT